MRGGEPSVTSAWSAQNPRPLTKPRSKGVQLKAGHPGVRVCTQAAPFLLRVCDTRGVSSPRVTLSWARLGMLPTEHRRGAAVGPGAPSPQVRLLGTPRGPSPARCRPQVAQLPLFVSDGKWHHICVTWTTRDGMWEAFQDGEKLGTGENLAPWHPIKPGGVLILGQEQVGAGGVLGGAAGRPSGTRPDLRAAPGPAQLSVRLPDLDLATAARRPAWMASVPAGSARAILWPKGLRAGMGTHPALPGRDRVGVVGSDRF